MDQLNPDRNTDPAAGQRTRELRAEIDRTREDLSETVNAIQDRLRPSTMASNAAETVKHTAMSKVREVADSDSVSYVAANPVPMTMVAIGVAGLAWLATAGRGRRYSHSQARRAYDTRGRDWNTPSSAPLGRERSYGYDDEATVATSGLSYPASDRGGSQYPREYRSGVANDHLGRPSQGSAQAYLQRAWRQNPLMVGLAAAVAGAVVGLGVPETERENELMGEVRDRMIDSVQDTVRDKVDQVQQAATTAIGSVQEAAQNAVGLGNPDTTDTRDQRAGQGSGA